MTISSYIITKSPYPRSTKIGGCILIVSLCAIQVMWKCSISFIESKLKQIYESWAVHAFIESIFMKAPNSRNMKQGMVLGIILENFNNSQEMSREMASRGFYLGINKFDRRQQQLAFLRFPVSPISLLFFWHILYISRFRNNCCSILNFRMLQQLFLNCIIVYPILFSDPMLQKSDNLSQIIWDLGYLVLPKRA